MKNAVLYLFLLLPLSGTCQNWLMPLSLLKLQDNYTFDNPAAAVLTESFDLKLLHSSYTGLPGKAGLNYLEGNFTIRNPGGSNAHVPGLVVHSEYETSILKRTRVYFRYSWNTNLSARYKLSAGIHGGFFNYSIRGSGSNNGMSAYAPDANAGLWLHGKKINMGISVAQLFNSKIQPVETVYPLQRYLSAIADYKLVSDESLAVTAGIRWNHSMGENRNLGRLMIGTVAEVKNFSAEINYLMNMGFTFSGGIIRIPVNNLNTALFFSYFYSGNKYLNNDRLEINVRIYFARTASEE